MLHPSVIISHLMRRPIRTRRLSITAILSLLLFAVMAVAEVRSLWITDIWFFGNSTFIKTPEGCVHYTRISGNFVSHITDRSVHDSWNAHATPAVSLFKPRFTIWRSPGNDFQQVDVIVPLVFPLPLLIVAPVLWLVARPAKVPAFPVVTSVRRA